MATTTTEPTTTALTQALSAYRAAAGFETRTSAQRRLDMALITFIAAADCPLTVRELWRRLAVAGMTHERIHYRTAQGRRATWVCRELNEETLRRRIAVLATAGAVWRKRVGSQVAYWVPTLAERREHEQVTNRRIMAETVAALLPDGAKAIAAGARVEVDALWLRETMARLRDNEEAVAIAVRKAVGR